MAFAERDRLPQPRDGGVRHRRRHRRSVLPRDQLPHPGRAPGDRGDHLPRPGARCSSRSPPAIRWRSGRTTSPTTATPSNAGSTPRIRATAIAPSPGRLSLFAVPERDGLRVDTHCQAGSAVPPYYDSLLAKLIGHGADREHAHRHPRRRPGGPRRRRGGDQPHAADRHPGPSGLPLRPRDHRLAGASAAIDQDDRIRRHDHPRRQPEPVERHRADHSRRARHRPGAGPRRLPRAGLHLQHAHGRLGPLSPGGPMGADPPRVPGDARDPAGDDHHRHALHLVGAGRRGGHAPLLPAGRAQRAAPRADRRSVQPSRACAADRRDGQGRGGGGGGDRAHLLDQRGPHPPVLRGRRRRVGRLPRTWTSSTSRTPAGC